MSDTNERNGWKHTLNDASISATINAPITIGAKKATNIGALGSKIIPNTAAIAPARMNGRRRPNRFHVLSDAEPTIGWTINPMIGATSQNSDSEWRSAPKSERIRLTFAFCSAKPNWTPRKPKLTFHICQKERRGWVACILCSIYCFTIVNTITAQWKH